MICMYKFQIFPDYQDNYYKSVTSFKMHIKLYYENNSTSRFPIVSKQLKKSVCEQSSKQLYFISKIFYNRNLKTVYKYKI